VSTSLEAPRQFLQEIRCGGCENQGHATWESSDAVGGLRTLASLSDGFQAWPAQEGHEPVITCNRCGKIQQEQTDIGT
jgi:ribosomal protein S27E